MKFYRGVVEIIDVEVDDKTQFKNTLIGEEKIYCSFVLETCFDFQLGDYILWRNKKFSILKSPPVKKSLSNKFEYSFELETDLYKTADALYMFDGQTDFPLTGNLNTFANLLIENLNRNKGSEYYSLGTCPTTETKNITLSNQDCLFALQKFSQEFNVEYTLSNDGTTFNFVDKIGIDTELVFQFKVGLRNISRERLSDSNNLVTKLYAFGSDRNISSDYGSKKLKIDPLEKNIATFGSIEGVVNFDEVYPKREGTISSVDISDVLKFTDSSIDFNINDQLLSGVTAKVTFNTGYLAGYEFEIESFNNSTKEFSIISYEDENGLVLPNETLKPSATDKYVIHDIKMPEQDIEDAEELLLEKAQEYIDEYSVPNVVYTITPDYIYLRQHLIQLNVGDLITIQDDDFDISFSTRIVSITQSIANPYLYTIKVGNKSVIGLISQIKEQQLGLETDIKIERDNRIISNNRIRKSLKNIDELRDSIFDTEGYFDMEKIKPLSVETSMLSVGTKGQQFILRELLIEPNFLGNKNTTKISNCTITHFTIEDTIKEWTLTGSTKTHADDAQYYYVYARCDRSGSTGDFLCTSSQYQVNTGSTYYYFLIGVVHSVIDNVRGISLTYGQTNINGKFISTGKIQSQDGNTWFDLDNGEIRGTLKFTSGENAKDYIDTAKTAAELYAEAKADLAEINAKAYADGEVSAEEARAIAEATDKLAEAKAYADAQDDAIEIGGRNYIILNSLESYTSYNSTPTVIGKVITTTYIGSTSLPWPWTLAITDFTPVAGFWTVSGIVKINGIVPSLIVWGSGLASSYGSNMTRNDYDEITGEFVITQSYSGSSHWIFHKTSPFSENDIITLTDLKFEKGNKATDWTPAPEDVTAEIATAKAEAESAAEAYAEAKADLAEVNAKAYADGEVSAEEARAIAEATAKLQLAKDYADAQDALQETLIKSYADGEISAAEANAIAIAEAKADLAEINAKAYADGEVSAEEARAIAEAAAKLQLAKDYADAQDSAIEIGGRNMVLDSYVEKVNTAFSNEYRNFLAAPLIHLEIGVYMLQMKMMIDPSAENDEVKAYFYGELRNGLVYSEYYSPTISDYSGIYKKYTTKLTVTSPGDILIQALVHNPNLVSVASNVAKIKEIKLEKGTKATDWTPAPEDVTAEISEAVQDLQDEVEGSFKDGIIEESEAIAIEKYLNAISNEKSTVDKEYTEVYANSSLTGTPKSDLNSYYTLFSTAYGNLVTSINSAIADGKTTVAEKNDVDAKFALFEVAKANYVEYYQDALEAIRQKNITDTKAYGDDEFGYLKTAVANNTRIEGGILFSTLVKLGAIDSGGTWNETAGMSGLPNDNIGYYLGGTYAQALADAAKIILRKDGSGQFAGGNFLFDTLGSVILKGLIEAVSGKIGAFDISADGISTDGIILDTSDLDALASIGGSVTSITVPSSATENLSNVALGVESVSVAYVESISITNASYLKFGVTNTIANIDTSSSLMQIKNATDDVVFSDLIAINDIKEYSVKLPSGTYEITFTTRGFPTDGFNTNNNSITAIAGESQILVEPISEMIKFSKNGGYMYFGTDKYFYFEKTHGLQVRLGSFVFKISSASGIQKSTNGGSSWTTL